MLILYSVYFFVTRQSLHSAQREIVKEKNVTEMEVDAEPVSQVVENNSVRFYKF